MCIIQCFRDKHVCVSVCVYVCMSVCVHGRCKITIFSSLLTDTYLYSEEQPADEVLRLRVLPRLAVGPRQATSPPSQVEMQ